MRRGFLDRAMFILSRHPRRVRPRVVHWSAILILLGSLGSLGFLGLPAAYAPSSGMSAGGALPPVIAGASAATPLAGGRERTSDLRLTVDGVRSGSGAIMIGLYDGSGGFVGAIQHSTDAGLLNDRGRVAGAALRAAAGSQSIIFTRLPPGRYAAIVFHDENDNGRLDENPWGVPVEGYGFSNNAQGTLGAPSFDAAGVTLDGTDKSIAITLIYPGISSGDLSELLK
jgi:uncharacterized protein (DUF2141 family)